MGRGEPSAKAQMQGESVQECTEPHNTRQRASAGWALQPKFYALYGSTSPTAVLQAAVAERPPEGADGRCPAGFALDSGQKITAQNLLLRPEGS